MVVNIINNKVKLKLEEHNKDRKEAHEVGYPHLYKSIPNTTPETEDIEFYEELSSKLDEQMVSIDKNDPFYQTDLIVFKDTYSGHLPLNGIREKDFKATKELFNKIASGNSNIKICSEESDPDDVLANILILLSREVGRDLIKQVTEVGKVLIISIDECGDSSIKHGDGYSVMSFNPYASANIVNSPRDGRKFLTPSPGFITFAHECIHFLHSEGREYSKVKNSSPTMGKDYQNGEEQRTISGFIKNFAPDFKSKETDFETNDLVQDEYDSLNEHRFDSNFGLSSRHNHLGAEYDYADYAWDNKLGRTKEMRVARLIRAGAHLNVAKGLNAKNVNDPIDNKGTTVLEVALRDGDAEMVRIILSCNPKIEDKHLKLVEELRHLNDRKTNYNAFLAHQISGNKYKFVESGLNLANINTPLDDKGRTALDFVIESGDEKMTHLVLICKPKISKEQGEKIRNMIPSKKAMILKEYVNSSDSIVNRIKNSEVEFLYKYFTPFNVNNLLDESGNTALDYALKYGSNDMIHVVLNHTPKFEMRHFVLAEQLEESRAFELKEHIQEVIDSQR